MFIKREIPILINSEKYYDITTPYGYGGPLIVECEAGKRNKLVADFEESFEKYSKENNIVSDFVRFHPILKNHRDFNEIYQIQYLRNTIATCLKDTDDPFTSEFSRSTRKIIRRSLKSGLTYKVIEKPKSIENFLEVYYSTMDRNEATDFYYFDKSYFKKCLEEFKENILIVEVLYKDKVIASSFNFKFNKTVHVHLSGTLSEYIKMSPAYIVKYATLEWANKNEIELIHYGGGTSNSPDDGLYRFKKRFTKETEFEFHIGKKIWNDDVYNKLCEMKNINTNVSFFPAYRKNNEV